MVPLDQFLFVSGIANRMGYFNMEAAPRSYAQSFVASHNAAVALAWMTPLNNVATRWLAMTMLERDRETMHGAPPPTRFPARGGRRRRGRRAYFPAPAFSIRRASTRQ